MKLTRREAQVANLVGKGARNAAIARRLGITERTVKMHLTNIFRRTGLTSRLQLAALVWRGRR